MSHNTFENEELTSEPAYFLWSILFSYSISNDINQHRQTPEFHREMNL